MKGYRQNGWKGANKKEVLIKSIEPVSGILIVAVFMVLNPDFAFIIFMSAFFSIAPDFIVFLSWKFGDGGFIEVEHIWHHHSGFVLGMIPQVLVFILAVGLLIQ